MTKIRVWPGCVCQPVLPPGCQTLFRTAPSDNPFVHCRDSQTCELGRTKRLKTLKQRDPGRTRSGWLRCSSDLAALIENPRSTGFRCSTQARSFQQPPKTTRLPSHHILGPVDDKSPYHSFHFFGFPHRTIKITHSELSNRAVVVEQALALKRGFRRGRGRKCGYTHARHLRAGHQSAFRSL